jgi:ABC-type transport system involved in multi-copper enzyme maturation permease subunit
MKQVGLLAINFLREQRWPILVLMLWVVLLAVLGLVVDLRANREEILFIFKQLAVYVVAFSVFFGASAIHNERKTRRILAVLSKSVGRGQYISGLLGGIVLATAIYTSAMGVTGTWVLGASGFPARQIWLLIFSLMLSCILSATVAVLFSTLLNPLFATMGTAIVLGVPAVAALHSGSRWSIVVPTYALLDPLMKAGFGITTRVSWMVAVLAVAEALLFWVFASWIFSRRDIAVAVD